jgi:hypothetical protein
MKIINLKQTFANEIHSRFQNEICTRARLLQTHTTSPRTPPLSAIVHSHAGCKLPLPPQSGLYHSRAGGFGARLGFGRQIWRTG